MIDQVVMAAIGVIPIIQLAVLARRVAHIESELKNKVDHKHHGDALRVLWTQLDDLHAEVSARK